MEKVSRRRVLSGALATGIVAVGGSAALAGLPPAQASAAGGWETYSPEALERICALVAYRRGGFRLGQCVDLLGIKIPPDVWARYEALADARLGGG